MMLLCVLILIEHERCLLSYCLSHVNHMRTRALYRYLVEPSQHQGCFVHRTLCPYTGSWRPRVRRRLLCGVSNHAALLPGYIRDTMRCRHPGISYDMSRFPLAWLCRRRQQDQALERLKRSEVCEEDTPELSDAVRDR